MGAWAEWDGEECKTEKESLLYCIVTEEKTG